MVRRATAVAGVAGGLLAVVGGWNLYQRATTETVPYTVVGHVDEVELRQYPETVLVETVASDENTAFRRLFRYITGANEARRDVEMTTPVETDRGTVGASISMTAPVEVEKEGRGTDVSMTTPVETDRTAEGVRMAFYLPASFDSVSAPRPTDDEVTLVTNPARTLAVGRFTWFATDDRVDREMRRLLDTLDESAVTVVDEPFFMGYDAPGTLPFLRRNEVAVEVRGSESVASGA